MVSVIIPTYNRAALLTRAVRTVLNQTHEDLEAIIIDDASEDHTKDIINNFSDERIKYIRLSKRKGAASARNIGIRKAGGKYLAFLDSDDEWHPRKIEYQVREIKKQSNKVGIVYTKTLRKYKNHNYYIPYQYLKRKDGYLYRNLILGHYMIPTPAVLIKKTCFEKCGYFDENFQVLEEWDLWIRISRFYNFKFINKTLTISHYTPLSLSTNRDLFALGIYKIIHKHLKDFICRPDALLLAFYRIARLYFGHFLYLMGWRGNK